MRIGTAAALVGAAASVSEPSAASDSGPSRDALDAASGSTHETALDRDDVQSLIEVDEVQNKLNELLGRRFGGILVQGSGPENRITVQVVDPTSADGESIDGVVELPGRTDILAVRYGMSDLQEATAALWQLRLPEGVGFGVEPFENRFVVDVPSGDGADAAAYDAAAALIAKELDARFEREMYEVRRVDGMPRATATNRWLPFASNGHAAGYNVHLYNGAAGASCTSGYVLKLASFPIGTTAGHCRSNGATVHQGGPAVMATKNWDSEEINGLWQNADLSLYPLPSSVVPRAQILVGSDSYRDVKSNFVSQYTPGGTTVCFQGQGSDNNNCGAVYRVDWTYINQNNFQNRHLDCMAFPALGGDSGGPVYQVRSDGHAKAAGMTSIQEPTNGDDCFSTIYWIMSWTGLNLSIK